MQRVDYDRIAVTYNQRYCGNPLTGIERCLVQLARQSNAQTILEVGCGTGRWLSSLANSIQYTRIYGLDYSFGMLAQAQNHSTPFHLIHAKAGQLPLKEKAFDLLFCVNALHHFDDPQNFITQAQQVLAPGGTLTIIGQVPQDRRNRWYVYEYFEGTYERDLERFPTWGTVMDWMVDAGFRQIHWKPIEWISDDKHGWSVLDDPFLKKQAVSQLALLSDEAYAAGIERIKQAIRKAEADEQILEFKAQLRLDLITAS